jgi:hypothetical protein
VVACRREEDLRLVFEAAEGLAVDDAIAIALERRPDRIFALGMEASTRVRALCGLRCEELPFARLEIFTDPHPSSKLITGCAPVHAVAARATGKSSLIVRAVRRGAWCVSLPLPSRGKTALTAMELTGPALVGVCRSLVSRLFTFKG